MKAVLKYVVLYSIGVYLLLSCTFLMLFAQNNIWLGWLSFGGFVAWSFGYHLFFVWLARHRVKAKGIDDPRFMPSIKEVFAT